MSALDRASSEGWIQTGVDLRRFTTYRLGGPARWYIEVEDRETLERVGAAWRSSEVPVLVIGRGSNLVVADEGFAGLVVRLSVGFGGVVLADTSVEAGGGTALATLARASVKAGRLGLEFFVGIPGSVGGAVRQNAGCLGSDTATVLLGAEVYDLRTGETIISDPAGLELAYRHSNLDSHQVVVSATFRTEPGDPDLGEARIREVTRWRKDHQPGGTLNAGSVFKNPAGDHAGRIIDSLGLKGYRVGGVAVSERHANFFVADASATAADLWRLVSEVRAIVSEKVGVILEPEIVFVGFED